MNTLLDSGNGFRAVVSESAFATANFDCSEFPRVSEREDRPISFASVEHSKYLDVWKDYDCAEFSGLWNSNAFRGLKNGELPKDAMS